MLQPAPTVGPTIRQFAAGLLAMMGKKVDMWVRQGGRGVYCLNRAFYIGLEKVLVRAILAMRFMQPTPRLIIHSSHRTIFGLMQSASSKERS
jgi:hypothetical protein